MKKMDLYLFARLHARPGQREAVWQAIREVQGPTREETGCLAYHAFQSLRDPDEFYIHSRWQDLAAFENHVGLPHTVRFAADVEALLDHPLTVSLTKQLPS
jgi:quinol monooxygenase YgiN